MNAIHSIWDTPNFGILFTQLLLAYGFIILALKFQQTNDRVRDRVCSIECSINVLNQRLNQQLNQQLNTTKQKIQAKRRRDATRRERKSAQLFIERLQADLEKNGIDITST